jgi:magnesium transporter
MQAGDELAGRSIGVFRPSGPVRSLVTLDGRVCTPGLDELRSLAADHSGAGYWLDIQDPDESDYALLLDDYHVHPLTVEDVRVQNQRPKLDEFTGYAFVVLFTAALRDGELAFQEHHLYVTGRSLLTIRHGPLPALDELRTRLAQEPELGRSDQRFVDYLVVNALVETLFPVLDDLDERIDRLEDEIIGRPPQGVLVRVTALRHSVSDLRRILGPQRDVFQRLLTHSLDQPGDELSLYWRDVYEHLVRQYEQVDSLRDLLTGTIDIYMSGISNRLNATMKQLTVIASLFLPLTFLTGFFGMNFGYLVGHIAAPPAFALGASLMILSTALQLLFFRRLGWI